MRLSKSTQRGLLLCLGFSLVFLFGLGSLSLVDYDEGAYAEVSREMLARGDLLRPYLNEEPWFEKPPMLYWGMVLGMKVFGATPLGVRLVNALLGVVLVGALFLFARRPLGERGAFLAALVLGCSLEFMGLTRVALTDLQLTLWMFCCLCSLGRAIEEGAEGRGGTRWFLLACLFSALAMLTKGLIGFVLPAGAVFFFCWRRKRLRTLFRPTWLVAGMPILFGVGLSWYLALGLEDGFGFMRELFLEHHVGRFLESKQKHGGPFFYYVPVLLLGFLPWSPFAVLELRRRWGDLRGGTDARAGFLQLHMMFAALTFAFFSLAATKLPNYVAPVLPALALLVGDLFAGESEAVQGREQDRGWKWSVGISAGIWAVVGVALILVPFLLPLLPRFMKPKHVQNAPGLLHEVSFGPWPTLAALVLWAGAVCAVLAWRRRRLDHVVVSFSTSLAALLVVASLFLLPRYDEHFRAPLISLGQRAAELAPADKKVVLVGIRHAPSVAFYGGRPTRYIGRNDVKGIAMLFAGSGPEVGLTTEGYVEKLVGPGRLEVVEERLGYVLFRCVPTPRSSAGGSSSGGE